MVLGGWTAAVCGTEPLIVRGAGLGEVVWSPPCLENCPLATRAACTTIELPLGLAENHHHATTGRAGVYILSGKEKHAPMTIREGLEHAGPVSPILFAPSDRPAARVREASRRLSLVMMAPWDTMGAYGDQITTSASAHCIL